MKRGAERQLVRDDDDDDDDDDIEEIQDPQGFQKADESTLAKRQIRALPKRASTASKSPHLNGSSLAPAPDAEKVDTAPQPKFGGFVGFGAGTSAPSPFTFIAQPPAVSSSSPSVFDTASEPASVSLFRSAPKPALPDTDTTLKSSASPPTDKTDTVAFKYFKSLRGLNVSFLSAISAAVEKDPFFDVANLVESYKSLRTTIQSEFDGSPQLSTIRGPATTNSGSTFTAKVPSDKTTSLFSIPKPSIGSAEPSPKLSLASENGTKTGGFTFPPFVPPSGSAPVQLHSGLTPKPSEPPTSSTPEPLKSALAFTNSNTSTSSSRQPPTSGFPFAVPLSTENAPSKSIFGPPSQETEGPSTGSQPGSTAPSSSGSMPNFFVATKHTSAFSTADASSKPSPAFGSSVFGSSSTTEFSKATPLNPFSSDSNDNSRVAPILFGNAAATASSISASNLGSSSDKAVSFFGSASQPKTSAFTFGKPGGSIGNPVGFGFGSSSPSTGDIATPGSSSSGFNFGAPSTKLSENLFPPPMTDKSSESTPQPEAECNEGGEEEAAKLLPTHTHDEEGEGEEDEETTHAVRCKIYRLSKSEDKNEWRDLGIGMFRLKKHRETNVRRVLMRNSNTGRILTNFRIYGSLKPTLAKTTISFVGYEDSTPTSFSVRVKTEEQARDLKQALEREVAAVQKTE